jgi:hypothetical protein
MKQKTENIICIIVICGLLLADLLILIFKYWS